MTQNHEQTCPNCGGHNFLLVVRQMINVVFTPDGSHRVVAGPMGDMQWDDDTFSTCNDCHHDAPLGEMKVIASTSNQTSNIALAVAQGQIETAANNAEAEAKTGAMP